MPLTPEEIKEQADADQKIIDNKAAADKALVDKEATGDTKDKDKDKDKDKAETFDVTVGGQTVHMTLEELTAAASKSAGADAKFEKAASDRKAGADGIRIQELAGKMNKGTQTETDVKEFATLMGGDADALMKQLNTAKAEDKKGKADKEASPVEFDKLDDRTKAALKAAEAQDISRIRAKIEEDVRIGVDKDPVLSKMVDEAPSESQQQLKNTLFDMAMDSVRGRILANESFGPEMISSVAQKVRSQIKNLGILSRAVGQPAVVGLGPAGVGVAPEVLAKEPIGRKSVTDPNYEDNAVKRMQQDMIKRAAAGAASGR